MPQPSFIVPKYLHWRRFDKAYHETTAQQLKAWNVDQISLVAPDKTVKVEGLLTFEECREVAETARIASAIYADQGIEAGIWYCPTFKTGLNPHEPNHPDFATYDFQPITDLNGTVSPHSYCPLDPKFQDYFSRFMAMLAEACKPPYIMLEDDFELSNHPGVTFGCFCPKHLDAFAEQVGQAYTREQLYELFQQKTPEAKSLRAAWAKLACDSLVAMSRKIREAVDAVAPATRIGLCEAGCTDFDGAMTLPVARALAGHTRPMIRGCGSAYSSDDPATLPTNIMHAMLVAQQRDPDVEWIHEVDCYPHTGYYSSGARLSALATNAMMYGADGAFYHALQSLDNPLEDTRYLASLKTNLPKWRVLHEIMRDAKPTGIQVVFSRETHNHRPYCPEKPVPGYALRNSPWARVLGHHGIPFRTTPGSIRCVAGDTIQAMTDHELDELFAGTVLLDGRAAWLAGQRGRLADLGLTATPRTQARSLREELTLPENWGTPPGQLMYFLQAIAAGTEGSNIYSLSLADGTEALTEFRTPTDLHDGVAMAMHHNPRGGRVATLCFDLEDNLSSSIFNHRRAWLLRHLVGRFAPDEVPVMADRDPKIFTLAAIANEGNALIVSLTNLSLDPVESATLTISDAWRGCTYEQLRNDGTWQKLTTPTETQAFESYHTVQPGLELHVAQPVILRLSK